MLFVLGIFVLLCLVAVLGAYLMGCVLISAALFWTGLVVSITSRNRCEFFSHYNNITRKHKEAFKSIYLRYESF